MSILRASNPILLSPPPPAGLTPSTVAGMIWHLQGGSGITLVGSKVSAWADQSGTADANKNGAQANDADRPVFNAADSAFNNQPTLAFAGDGVGSARKLETGGWTAPALRTTFLVLSASVDGWVYDGRLGLRTYLVFNNDGSVRSSDDSFNMVTSATGPVPMSKTILCITCNGASSSIRRNAITATSGTGTQSGDHTSGFFVGGSIYGYTGKIAEVAMYNHAVSDANRATIMNILATKYLITIAA